MKSCAQSTVSHNVDDEHTVPVPGTWYRFHTLNSQRLPGPRYWWHLWYLVPSRSTRYQVLDIRSESIIYVGLQWYNNWTDFLHIFLWWKSSTFFRKAGAEKMNHGGSKQKPLLTELAVRKNMDEIPHRFTYRNYICSTFFCTSSLVLWMLHILCTSAL